MYHGNCKCPHHWVIKILMLLVWVAGVLFFWSGLKGAVIWGYDPLFYAWSVVVLSLMMFSCKVCGCCGWGVAEGIKSKFMDKVADDVEKTMAGAMCSHNDGCKCGDCNRCM